MAGVRDRRLPIMFGVFFMAMAAIATPALGQAPSCLDGIERLMREYQARYYEIANTNPNLNSNVIDWPPCCPSEKAPAFPPDGYYDSALQGDPQFAVELVKALQKVMCEFEAGDGSGNTPMAIVGQGDGGGWFNRDPHTDGECGEVPGNDDLPRWTVGEAFGDCNQSVPVTVDTYCGVFVNLEIGIHRLRTIRLPEDRVVRGAQGTHRGPAYGQCGQTPEPNCDAPIWDGCPQPHFCTTGQSPTEALEKVRDVLHCVWGNVEPYHPTDCIPHFFEIAFVSNNRFPPCHGGSTEAGDESTPPFWATIYRDTCENVYTMSWGDLSGPRRTFFKLNFKSATNPSGYGSKGGVDSKFRQGDTPGVQGDILGLPVTYCRVADPPYVPGQLPLPDWYCIPTAKLGHEPYKTSAGFGATDGQMWGQFPDYLGDECTAAETNIEDWPAVNVAGERGWLLGGVAGLANPDFNSDPERGRDCGSTCSTCTGSLPRPALGSIDFSWSLGRSSAALNGAVSDRSAGYVLLRARSIPDRTDAVNGAIYPENVIKPNRLVRNFQPRDAAITKTVDAATITEFAIEAENTKIEVHAESLNIPPYKTRVTTYAKIPAPNGAAGATLEKTAETIIEQRFEWSPDGQQRHHIIQIAYTPDPEYGSGTIGAGFTGSSRKRPQGTTTRDRESPWIGAMATDRQPSVGRPKQRESQRSHDRVLRPVGPGGDAQALECDAETTGECRA